MYLLDYLPYLHYQKIYQNVFISGKKQDHIEFQKEFFISELNDLPSLKSFNFPELNDLRAKFIQKRKELFREDFFKSFPVILVAAGHYPKDYNFDLEEIFGVSWVNETHTIDKQWYNLHYSSDKKRLLIHTRQLSTSVSNNLVDAISTVIKDFLENQSR